MTTQTVEPSDNTTRERTQWLLWIGIGASFLSIVGILSFAVISRKIAAERKASAQRLRMETLVVISDAEKQVKLQKTMMGAYLPGNDNVWAILVHGMAAEGRRFPGVIPSRPIDSYGAPLHYEWPNAKDGNSLKPAIWSNGPNGINDGGAGDDITNW